MILDKNQMYMDSAAYDATPAVIDHGVTSPGKGGRIRVSASGVSVAGLTAIVLKDGTTSSPATVRLTLITTAAALNAGAVVFDFPNNVQRYTTVALTDASAGTLDIGIVEAEQSNL
jgi:hypothetical protein